MSVEAQSQQLIEALKKLQLEQGVKKFEYHFPQRQETFSQCFSPITQDIQSPLNQEGFQLQPRKLTEFQDDLSYDQYSPQNKNSSIKSTTLSMFSKPQTNSRQVYKKSLTQYDKSNGKKTPLEIEQELLNELQEIELIEGSDDLSGMPLELQNFEITGNFQTSNDEGLSQKDYPSHAFKHANTISQSKLSQLDLNDIENKTFQERLELKKKQIRDASRGKDLNKPITTQLDMSQDTQLDSQIKIRNKVNKLQINSLQIENQGLQPKETPRFKGDKIFSQKKIQNINIDKEDIELLETTKMLNFQGHENFDQIENVNPISEIQTSEFFNESYTPDLNPRKKNNFVAHQHNKHSEDLASMNYTKLQSNLFSNDQSFDQISAIDNQNKSTSEYNMPFLNQQISIENQLQAQNRFKSESRVLQNADLNGCTINEQTNFQNIFNQNQFQNQQSPIPSCLTSERNTFNLSYLNGYLRRDMYADCDDKYSDKTLQSVFNQFQSQNTSFILGGVGDQSQYIGDAKNHQGKENKREDDFNGLQDTDDIENLNVQIDFANQMSTPQKSISTQSKFQPTFKLNLPFNLATTSYQEKQVHILQDTLNDNDEIKVEGSEWAQIVNEAKDNFNKSQNNLTANAVSNTQGQIGNQPSNTIVPLLNINTQNRTYLRHLIKQKPKLQSNPETQHTTSYTMGLLNYSNTFDKQLQLPAQSRAILLLNASENPNLLEDNILFLVLIGKKNLHTYLISDQEASRCRFMYKNLLNKSKGDCHEAFFGLAKIYFHLNKLDVAYDCILKAIQQRKQDDWVYLLWEGFILYYLISFSQLKVVSNEIYQVQKWLRESDRCLTKVLKLKKDSIAAMFLLLKLSLWSQKYVKKYKYSLARHPKDYALKLKKQSDYYGYLAWAEVYISQREKRQLGIQVLEDLIKDFSHSPQAYLRLWNIYSINQQHAKSLELAEKLYIFGTGYAENGLANSHSKDITIFRSSLITLLFAKSLFLNREYLRCYELLQNEFMAFPQFFSILYAYAKYVIRADEQCQFNYLGSAVGALEECLRSQVKERHPKLYLYLGKAYLKMNQPLRVYENWMKYLQCASKKQTEKRKMVKEQLKYFESFAELIAKIDGITISQIKSMEKQKLNIIDLDGHKFLEQIERQELLDQPTKLLTKAKIYAYLLKDQKKAVETYEKLITDYVHFLDGYISYWNYLKRNKNYHESLRIAQLAMKASESTKVPTSLWVLSRMNMSKSYLIDRQIKKSIEVLKEICYILPPFPMCELNFVETVLEHQQDQDSASDLETVRSQQNDQENSNIFPYENNQYNSSVARNYFSFANTRQNTAHRKYESIQLIQVDDSSSLNYGNQNTVEKLQEDCEYFNYQNYGQQSQDFFENKRIVKRKMLLQQSIDSPFLLASQVEDVSSQQNNLVHIDEKGRVTSQFNKDYQKDPIQGGVNQISPRKLIFTESVIQQENKVLEFNNNLQVNNNAQRIVHTNRTSFAFDQEQQNYATFSKKQLNVQQPSRRISRFSFMQNSSRRSTQMAIDESKPQNQERSSKIHLYRPSVYGSISNYSNEDMKSQNTLFMDSEGFAVYSNTKFLLQIGKICAETGQFLEDGMGALNDYMQILEYYEMDIPEENYRKLQIKAQYYIGIIFYKERDYEMAQQYLVEILIDLKEKGYQDKYEKAQNKLSKIYRRQKHREKESMQGLVEKVRKVTQINQFVLYLEKNNQVMESVQQLQDQDVIICRNTDTFSATDEDFDVSSMSYYHMDELREYRFTQQKQKFVKKSFGEQLTQAPLSCREEELNLRSNKINIAVIGESGVGKTSLINRYIFSKFSTDYNSTIEDFYTTRVQIIPKNESQPRNFTMELVDTAGLEELQQLRAGSLKDQDGYIFMFSCDNRATFDKVHYFINQIKNQLEMTARNSNQSTACFTQLPSMKIPVLIVGNKFDIDSNLVTFDDVNSLKKQYFDRFLIEYVQASAKTCQGINLAFQSIAKMVVDQRIEDDIQKFQKSRKSQKIKNAKLRKRKIQDHESLKCCAYSNERKCSIF
eukprot:403366804